VAQLPGDELPVLLDTTTLLCLGENSPRSGEHNSIAGAPREPFESSVGKTAEAISSIWSPDDLWADGIQHYLGDMRTALEWSFGSPEGSDGGGPLRMAATSSQFFLAKSLFCGVPRLDGRGRSIGWPQTATRGTRRKSTLRLHCR